MSLDKREAVACNYSIKKVFLKISKNSQRSTFIRIFFYIKLQAFISQIYQKMTPVKIFSDEFC